MHFPKILLLFSSLACVADCTVSDHDKALSELKSLGAEATSFCSSYLGIPKTTITAATVTPYVTVTTTVPITTTTIRVDRRSVPTPGACVFGFPCQQIDRRNHHHHIPIKLLPFSQAIISLACSFLHITPTVTTVTATVPTKTITITSPVTATATVTRANCDADASYNGSGNGMGNTVDFVPAMSALECCQTCQTTVNCVANAYVQGQCQLLEKIEVSPDAPTSDMCPLGLAGYSFGNHGGIVFKGPCA
ncbi:hypothetical protein Q9L58_001517 [Maublancomyces gigas]|uniref:Apple domain-containing protein n=1 Tax=Discina gigas TaxID=1032678 RepID=A0ABR3GUG9_9PEZI